MSLDDAVADVRGRIDVHKGVRQTSVATMALLFCFAASAWAAAQSLSSLSETAAATAVQQRAAVSQDPGLYLELQLAQPVKISKLNTGDVLQGKLSRDAYRGDQQVFAAGSPVRLTVGKLERRKRESNDHWPGVIQLFSPRHENYATFESASVLTPGGTQVTLRVSLISISRRVEVPAGAKSREPAQPSASPVNKPGAASAGTATVPAQNDAEPGSPPPAKQRANQTMILEAADPAGPSRSDVPAPTLPLGPVTLPTGTQAQVVLLTSVSAAKSHPGDSFRAQLVEPVRLGSRVILPEGCLFEGKVVKATPPRRLSRPGSLYLTFTGLACPEAEAVPSRPRLPARRSTRS